MDKKEKKKPDLRRLLVGLISVAWIAYMWVKKDVLSLYSGLSGEELAPLAVTTAAVSLLKVLALAAGVLLLKWLAGKMAKKKN